ncbi:MAG TPA: hypothetical protein VE476_07125 [Propionibacteriaceae bacterium]|nr:hypothetical protein [Propionibacteriaceae bacterium]
MATAVTTSIATGRPRLSADAVPLLLVGLMFLVLQLAFAPRPWGLTTDEATYLAKVDPSAPELYWSPPRAWGMPVLAAPVAIFAPGLTVVRLWFSTLSSVGLVAAYWPWLRVLHPGVAPVAALLFSTTWFTLYFGPGVMPNLYLGLAAVAAVGMFLRAVDSPRWWRSTLCGAAAALAALVRPTDSVLALAPLLVCGLAVPRLRRARELAAVAAGLIIGWVPWLVEAYVRFGGPLTRLRNAETAGPGGLSLDLKNLLVYPRLLDGRPTYCCTGPPSEAGPIPWMFTAWLTAIPVLALLGVLVAARRGQLPEMVLVGLPAVLSTGFYLLLPSFTSLRFLLPAFALIFLPVAALLVASLAVGRWWARGISVALAAAMLLGHLTLMLPQASEEFERDAPVRKRQILVTAALRSHIQGRACLVVGVEAQATAYYLGCRVQGARPFKRPPRRVVDAQKRGHVVVAVLRDPPADGSYLASWRELPIKGLPRRLEAYAPPG